MTRYPRMALLGAVTLVCPVILLFLAALCLMAFQVSQDRALHAAPQTSEGRAGRFVFLISCLGSLPFPTCFLELDIDHEGNPQLSAIALIFYIATGIGSALFIGRNPRMAQTGLIFLGIAWLAPLAYLGYAVIFLNW